MNGIPSISPSHTNFIFRGGRLYFVDPEGTEHKVTKAIVIANGVRDLCWAKGDKSGEFKVKKLAETPPEKIVHVPEGDILLLDFEPSYNSNFTMFLDTGSDVKTKEMIKKIMKLVGFEKGKDFDMYGGDDYESWRHCS